MTSIVIVGGLPCSGKSSLATLLQARLGWPLLAKDVIKETLFDALACGDREWSRRLSHASYALLYVQLAQMLRTGVDCIVEGNFRSEQALRLREMLAADRCIQVLCKADGAVLLARFAARARSANRHPGHMDLESLDELAPELSMGRAPPLPLPGPLFEFDSTTATPADSAVFVNKIAAFARGEVAE